MSVGDKGQRLTLFTCMRKKLKLHTYVNHTLYSVTRMRHGRETRTSVATLGLPPVQYIRSQRAFEVLELSDRRQPFHV